VPRDSKPLDPSRRKGGEKHFYESYEACLVMVDQKDEINPLCVTEKQVNSRQWPLKKQQ
jgi:hypothetical protein